VLNSRFEPITPRLALGIVFLTILLIFFISQVLVLLFGEYISQSSLFLVEVFTIVPASILVWQRRLPYRKIFRLNPIRRSVALVSVVIGIFLTILVDELDRLLQILIPMPEQWRQLLEEAFRFSNVQEFLIILFTAIFLAAVCEEMLFRGFFQGILERRGDIAYAVVVSAVLFATMHLNPWWAIQISILGVVLGLLAWKSNSIFPAAIVHGINNSFAIYFSVQGESELGWYLWQGHVNPIILLTSAVAVGISLRWSFRLCKEGGDNKEKIDLNGQV